jgi:TetR/AcrR family transcriptional repressor of lmrAB and yxaGH operons
MIAGGLELVRRNGYSATSFRDVWTLTDTPRGSVYFHFPGGKEELGLEVIERHSKAWLTLISRAADTVDSADSFLGGLVDGIAVDMRESGFELGCAVQAVAVEMSASSETLRQATAECYQQWTDAVAQRLQGFSVPPERSRALASATVAALTGALTVARSLRSTEPFDHVADLLRELARTAGESP